MVKNIHKFRYKFLEKEIFRPVCLLRGGVLSVRNRMFLNIF